MSNFLIGFLAGAAAGAIAGILFAPDKGSQTRQNLRKKLRDLSDEYGLGLSDLMDELGLEPEATRAKRGTKSPRPQTAEKRKYTRKSKPSADQ